MKDLYPDRVRFEAIGNTYAAAETVTRENDIIAGIPCAWFIPAGAEAEEIVFYTHGGGFVYGSLESHAPLVSHIALALNRTVLLIDYRLAPEFPFPAGLDDCLEVIGAIRAAHPGRRFAIIGDSAGGNLAIAAQLRLRAAGGPPFGYSIVLSPWLDLACTNASYNRNALAEQVLSQSFLQGAARMYAGREDLSDPLVSPVHGDFDGFPPVLILCGSDEILEDDSILFHRKLTEAGATARLELFSGEQHVWPFADIHSSASQRALQEMVRFAAQHTASKDKILPGG